MTWSSKRVKDVADIFNGYPFDANDFSDEGDLPLVRIRDILADEFGTHIDRSKVPASAVIRNGDIVIGMDGDFNCVRWSRGAAALNQRLCVLRARPDTDPRYLSYCLPAPLKMINDLTYSTTVKHLSSTQVARIRLTMPPIEEQRVIADYLDRETAKIDALIAKQEQLIATLHERRNALFLSTLVAAASGEPCSRRPQFIGKHRAIEPLLEVLPGDWDVPRFKAVTQRLEVRNADLVFPMLSLRSTGEVVMRSTLGGRQEPDEGSLPHYLVAKPGQLVVNPMWLVGGSIGVAQLEGAVSPDYRVFSFSEQVNPKFAHYLLRSKPYIDQYRLYTRAQTTFDRRVQQPDLDNMPMILPPLSVQQSVVLAVRKAEATSDVLIDQAEKFILLARERRSSLITAAVSGGLISAH